MLLEKGMDAKRWPQPLDDFAARGNVAAAAAAQGLAECAGEDVDAAATPQCSGVPRPVAPMKPVACESSTITSAP